MEAHSVSSLHLVIMCRVLVGVPGHGRETSHSRRLHPSSHDTLRGRHARRLEAGTPYPRGAVELGSEHV